MTEEELEDITIVGSVVSKVLCAPVILSLDA